MTTKPSSSEANDALLGNKILRFFSGLQFPKVRRPTRLPGLQFVEPSDLIFLALFSASCATAIIVVISVGVTEARETEKSILLGLSFIVLLLFYRFTQNILLRRSSRSIENALDDQRKRLADKLLRLNLQDIQHINEGPISNGLSRYYEPISQSIMPILSGFQAAILLVFIIAFLFFQSLLVGFLTLVFVFFIIRYYFNREEELTRLMTETSDAEAKLRSISREIFSGFKELKLAYRKRIEIYAGIERASERVAASRAGAAAVIGDLVVLSASSSYMLGATVVFLLPAAETVSEFSLSQIVTTELFLLGPLGAFVRAAEPLSNVRFAFEKIERFEAVVDERLNEKKTSVVDIPVEDMTFETLALQNVSYLHDTHDDGFAGIRNISFEVKRGETIFITGGNGSGKTTLLRVLTGLYEPQQGKILLDRKKIDASTLSSYQGLFATVFADFHTFDELYGMNEEDLKDLQSNLKLLGLTGRVSLDENYAPTALSTGQRKRLALAIAMTEFKPILILDEWAADQDPEFRAYFYATILPAIKARGTTIIAVTHDERYFNGADRRYHMEDGQLKEVK